MPFCILNIVVSENYSEQHFPYYMERRIYLFERSLSQIFVVVLASLFHVQTSF